jgi:hypothetical protein
MFRDVMQHDCSRHDTQCDERPKFKRQEKGEQWIPTAQLCYFARLMSPPLFAGANPLG